MTMETTNHKKRGPDTTRNNEGNGQNGPVDQSSKRPMRRVQCCLVLACSEPGVREATEETRARIKLSSIALNKYATHVCEVHHSEFGVWWERTCHVEKKRKKPETLRPMPEAAAKHILGHKTSDFFWCNSCSRRHSRGLFTTTHAEQKQQQTEREEKLTIEMLRLKEQVAQLSQQKQKLEEEAALKEQQQRQQQQARIQQFREEEREQYTELKRWAYVKLHGRFSRDQWRLLRGMRVDIPSEYRMDETISAWNARIIKEIPVEQGEGFVRVAFKTYVTKVAEFHQARGKLDSSTIHIKVSGDGRNISRAISNNVFCFSLTNLGEEANELV
jgi:hypothetical protein